MERVQDESKLQSSQPKGPSTRVSGGVWVVRGTIKWRPLMRGSLGTPGAAGETFRPHWGISRPGGGGLGSVVALDCGRGWSVSGWVVLAVPEALLPTRTDAWFCRGPVMDSTWWLVPEGTEPVTTNPGPLQHFLGHSALAAAPTPMCRWLSGHWVWESMVHVHVPAPTPALGSVGRVGVFLSERHSPSPQHRRALPGVRNCAFPGPRLTWPLPQPSFGP